MVGMLQVTDDAKSGDGETRADRAILLDRILTRAADAIGDLHGPVMQAYYERFPEAVAMFEQQGATHRHKLEGEMIESVLYCIMTWVERPAEVAIVLASTVPHHGAALQIPVACFSGFIDEVMNQIAGTLPPDSAEEVALLAEIRGWLHRETADAARDYHLS